MTLVGHSYSGFVIAGVADRLPERVARLVFLDAFIPEDGQCLFDLLGPRTIAGLKASLVDAQGRSLKAGASEVWLFPPGKPQDYGVTASEDVAWLEQHMVYTPLLTFEEPVTLRNPAAAAIPRVFIRCTEFPFLEPQEAKARAAGWPVYHIATGHDAMVTEPAAVAKILLESHEAGSGV